MDFYKDTRVCPKLNWMAPCLIVLLLVNGFIAFSCVPNKSILDKSKVFGCLFPTATLVCSSLFSENKNLYSGYFKIFEENLKIVKTISAKVSDKTQNLLKTTY